MNLGSMCFGEAWRRNPPNDIFGAWCLVLVGDFIICAAAGADTLILYCRLVAGQFGGPVDVEEFRRVLLLAGIATTLIMYRVIFGRFHRLGETRGLVHRVGRSCGIASIALAGCVIAIASGRQLSISFLAAWQLVFALETVILRRLFEALGRREGRGRSAAALVGEAGVRRRAEGRVVRDQSLPAGSAPAAAFGREDGPMKVPDKGYGKDFDYSKMDSDGLVFEWSDLQDRPMAGIVKMQPANESVDVEEDGDPAGPDDDVTMQSQPQLDVGWQASPLGLAAKICLDKIVAVLLLVGLAPLLIAIAIAVAIDSPGPVIFRQTRQGWQGREFVVLKFRTMRHEPAIVSRQTQTMRDDPRCTAIGRLLRACSIDEFPQLWNVLRGEMSLVGPRPHAESLHHVDEAGRQVLAEYARRHRVKPGITGWAQIHGLRGATATAEHLRKRIDYDLYYIENWSFWLDLKILALTPFRMAGENVF